MSNMYKLALASEKPKGSTIEEDLELLDTDKAKQQKQQQQGEGDEGTSENYESLRNLAFRMQALEDTIESIKKDSKIQTSTSAATATSPVIAAAALDTRLSNYSMTLQRIQEEVFEHSLNSSIPGTITDGDDDDEKSLEFQKLQTSWRQSQLQKQQQQQSQQESPSPPKKKKQSTGFLSNFFAAQQRQTSEKETNLDPSVGSQQSQQRSILSFVQDQSLQDLAAHMGGLEAKIVQIQNDMTLTTKDAQSISTRDSENDDDEGLDELRKLLAAARMDSYYCTNNSNNNSNSNSKNDNSNSNTSLENQDSSTVDWDALSSTMSALENTMDAISVSESATRNSEDYSADWERVWNDYEQALKLNGISLNPEKTKKKKLYQNDNDDEESLDMKALQKDWAQAPAKNTTKTTKISPKTTTATTTSSSSSSLLGSTSNHSVRDLETYIGDLEQRIQEFQKEVLFHNSFTTTKTRDSAMDDDASQGIDDLRNELNGISLEPRKQQQQLQSTPKRSNINRIEEDDEHDSKDDDTDDNNNTSKKAKNDGNDGDNGNNNVDEEENTGYGDYFMDDDDDVHSGFFDEIDSDSEDGGRKKGNKHKNNNKTSPNGDIEQGKMLSKPKNDHTEGGSLCRRFVDFVDKYRRHLLIGIAILAIFDLVLLIVGLVGGF